MCVCVCVCVYINIICVYVYICVCVYIYIYGERERNMLYDTHRYIIGPHELPHVRRHPFCDCETQNSPELCATAGLAARQIARHAASCRRREVHLSMPSRVSSLKLSEDASRPSPGAPARADNTWILFVKLEMAKT